MITLTIIILGKLIYSIIHNKPVSLRISTGDLMSGLVGIKALAKVAGKGLFKYI